MEREVRSKMQQLLQIIERTCQQCDNKFEPSKYTENRQQFCSKRCYERCRERSPEFQEYKRQHQQKYIRSPKGMKYQLEYNDKLKQNRILNRQIVEKTCENKGCNNKFNLPLRRQPYKRFCSKKCYCQAACPTPRNTNCKRCDKEIMLTSQNNYTTIKQFCSIECRYPSKFISCKNCNVQYRPTSRMDKSNGRFFCSKSCYRKFTGETNLEKIVKSSLDNLGINYTQEMQMDKYSIDFGIPNYNIAIEVDGAYWHKNTQIRDHIKTKYLVIHGWSIIRLSETQINSAQDLECVIAKQIVSTMRWR